MKPAIGLRFCTTIALVLLSFLYIRCTPATDFLWVTFAEIVADPPVTPTSCGLVSDMVLAPSNTDSVYAGTGRDHYRENSYRMQFGDIALTISSMLIPSQSRADIDISILAKDAPVSVDTSQIILQMLAQNNAGQMMPVSPSCAITSLRLGLPTDKQANGKEYTYRWIRDEIRGGDQRVRSEATAHHDLVSVDIPVSELAELSVRFLVPEKPFTGATLVIPISEGEKKYRIRVTLAASAQGIPGNIKPEGLGVQVIRLQDELKKPK